MIENNPSNVSSAFEMLLEELEAEIDFVNRVGARAFEHGDTNKVEEALQHSKWLVAFRDRVAALLNEWETMATQAAEAEDDDTRAERKNLGRLRKGLRTCESEFYLPILEILDQMGGRGKMAEVLERVEEVMRPVLREVDYAPLASDPDHPRWRNTAQWARNSMVQEGLLKDDSPRGVWEISDKGRALLRQSPRETGGSEAG
ncbi:MAG: winged helix-turn-helix domain-containing protein [Candidatus Sumerlaeaceae bacterium]|nr:winged helix-turn-helix domain-containing protein [Candidatus Sumerlaeaceae bacterium]